MRKINVLKLFLTITGWRQFLRVLNKKEKFIFFVFSFLTFSSLIFLSTTLYYKNTKIVPAEGGKFTEGVVGHPRFINPIYAETSDVDRDLTELIFSGLMKYGPGGEIVLDLAKDYEVLEQGRVYEFHLREDAFWNDGKKVKSDDVIFTIKTIQNPEIKSPLLPNWLGVEIEKIGDSGVRFKLKDPYSAFLERATVKIMPEHVWKDVLPKNFPLVTFNLKPVGSGPYQLKDLYRDEKGEISSLELILNKKYYGKIPKISQFLFKFFDSENDLAKSASRDEVSGFSPSSNLKDELTDKAEFDSYRFNLLRYFAIFFNPKNSKVLSDEKVREALNYGTNKKEILEKILGNRGRIVDSPLLSDLYKFNQASTTYEFNVDKAKEILEKAGFLEKNGERTKVVKKEPAFHFKSTLKQGSEGKEVEELQKCLAQDKEIYPLAKIDGKFDSLTKNAVIRFQEKHKIESDKGKVLEKTRAELNEMCFGNQEEIIPLKLSLITVDQPMLKETAQLIKEQWKTLGAEIDVETLNVNDLERNVIKPREYEALLFGEVLGIIPDPFPFWHSSQMEFGLNLAGYKNKKADGLMEGARIELDGQSRTQKYEELQEIIIEDMPAIFLYNPDYVYFVSKEIKGMEGGLIIDTSKRFAGVENWYIKTKRTWK